MDLRVTCVPSYSKSTNAVALMDTQDLEPLADVFS